MIIMRNCLVFFLLFPILFGACNKPLESVDSAGSSNKNGPEITSLSRLTALPGDTLKIFGNNIDSTTFVLFGDNSVPVTGRGSGYLEVMIPQGTGGTYITLGSGFLRSNKTAFSFYTLPMPSGIQFGGTAYTIDTISQYSVGPGTIYTAMNFKDIYLKTFPLRVHLITIDSRNPYVKMKPVLAKDTLDGLESIAGMATRKSMVGQNYFAGVNVNDDLIQYRTGSSFNPVVGKITYPLMIDYFPITVNGGIAANVTGYWHAEALFNQGKMYFFDTANYQGAIKLATGEEYGLQGFNSPRSNGNLVVYTPERGKTTRTNQFGYDLICKPQGSLGNFTDVKLKVVRTLLNSANIRLDTANNWVVSGHGAAQNFLQKAKVGDIISLSAFYSGSKRIQPDQIIGGERFLLQNGKMFEEVQDWNTRLARTAIGASADGYKIYLCVVDAGDPVTSVGVFTTHLAKIMDHFGAYNAINLDGGEFSSMYVKSIGYNGTGLMNRPAGATNYPNVMTGLFATSSAPSDGTVSSIAAQDYLVRVVAGASYTPLFYGVNQYGHIVNSNLSGVSISASGSAGTVSGNTFTAGTAGSNGVITASYNGLTTTIRVIVE